MGTSCGPASSCPRSVSRVCRGDRRVASGTCLPQSVGFHPLPGALSTHTAACRLCRSCTAGSTDAVVGECPDRRRIAAGCAL